MKIKTTFLFITFILILIITNCGEITSQKENSNNKRALNEIKKEPKIKHATITDANVLYVSVEDDGTIRNGYAEYLCEILREYRATTKIVKVIKASSLENLNNENGHGILLGEANCE
ncbi:hypothetical protein D0817_21020 [Flavobacterium cupreum]|uniref:Uncharacterized protein n=1 Tax=Flavobacterium cupreum TaxID=2133766 RepID=A0A434A1Z0_9FLAO|nr:hypothetical protein [Flavobacterium cupreum]RUT68399.1 hypothetical protein D0817_21020 [Flavobacterium cupreum]